MRAKFTNFLKILGLKPLHYIHFLYDHAKIELVKVTDDLKESRYETTYSS